MAQQKYEITQLVTSTESKVHSLKAAIFHTMAHKMSLEINKGNITIPTRRSFLKVFHNVCQIKKNASVSNNITESMLTNIIESKNRYMRDHL